MGRRERSAKRKKLHNLVDNAAHGRILRADVIEQEGSPMRIASGFTRIAILTRTHAIKIALPIRPLTPFVAAFAAWRRGEFLEKLAKHKGRILRESAKRIVSGIACNRQEIRLSKKYPDCPMIAPVLKSYLHGWIIVMPRGEKLTEYPAEWFYIRESLPRSLRETDLFVPHNLARFGQKVLVIDYGCPGVEEVLDYLFNKNTKAA